MSITRNSFQIKPPSAYVQDQLSNKHQKYQDFFDETCDKIHVRLVALEQDTNNNKKMTTDSNNTSKRVEADFLDFKQAIESKVEKYNSERHEQILNTDNRVAYARYEAKEYTEKRMKEELDKITETLSALVLRIDQLEKTISNQQQISSQQNEIISDDNNGGNEDDDDVV